jgi:hypothetical protein
MIIPPSSFNYRVPYPAHRLLPIPARGPGNAAVPAGFTR